jgi:multiple sugar transport system permease protein
MIIYLAGLQDIPRELYEAATVDGANPLRKFIHITVPSLRPVTFFVVTVTTIYSFQIYDQVAAISRYGVLGQPAGRTSTLITYFMQHGIRYMEIGYGSAAVVIFTLIILAITYIQKLLLVKEG